MEDPDTKVVGDLREEFAFSTLFPDFWKLRCARCTSQQSALICVAASQTDYGCDLGCVVSLLSAHRLPASVAAPESTRCFLGYAAIAIAILAAVFGVQLCESGPAARFDSTPEAAMEEGHATRDASSDFTIRALLTHVAAAATNFCVGLRFDQALLIQLLNDEGAFPHLASCSLTVMQSAGDQSD